MASQKRLRVIVDDAEKAAQALSNMVVATSEVDNQLAPQADVKAKIVSSHVVEIFADIPATEVLLTLAQNGVTATNIINVGDDLENYYMQLINGGGKNA